MYHKSYIEDAIRAAFHAGFLAGMEDTHNKGKIIDADFLESVISQAYKKSDIKVHQTSDIRVRKEI